MNVEVPELKKSVKIFRNGISWILATNKLLEQYLNYHQSEVFEEETMNKLKEIMRKKNYLLDHKIEVLLDSISEIPEFILQSKEYEKILDLYQKSQSWNEKCDEILNSDRELSEITDLVPGLVKEAELLPISQDKLSQIKNISKLFIWAK